MADHKPPFFNDDNDSANMLPPSGKEAQAGRQRLNRLPPWRVLLHNDAVNAMDEVVETIHRLTPLSRQQALARMREAHVAGSALLLVTHRERAELYVDQFWSCRLKVSIEPDE